MCVNKFRGTTKFIVPNILQPLRGQDDVSSPVLEVSMGGVLANHDGGPKAANQKLNFLSPDSDNMPTLSYSWADKRHLCQFQETSFCISLKTYDVDSTIRLSLSESWILRLKSD